MKTNSVDFLLNPKKIGDQRIYFLSGNEISMIQGLKEGIVKSFVEKKNNEVLRIQNITLYKNEKSLFSNNKIVCVEEIKGLTEKIISELILKDDVFVFESMNSPSNKKIKSFLASNKNSLLIECYELDKNSKIKIIKAFLNDHNKSLDENIFWYLVDVLDNKYGYLIRELEKINNLNNDTLKKIENVKMVLSNSYTGSEKIFFDILKTNDFLVDCYRKRINDETDLNYFFYSFKNFSSMLLDNLNESEFTQNLPKYLFKEKENFLNIFKKINDNKRRGLIKLLYKTEKMMRINFNKNKELGLRFLLNYKKIIVS